LVLLRALADKTGLAGLSKALMTPRLLIHDRGRVLADLAVAIGGWRQVRAAVTAMAGGRQPGGRAAVTRGK
jgi:hypothetical protein